MKRKTYFLSISCLLLFITAWGQEGIQTNTLTEEGAWCWFADPRAISYENEEGTINTTYIGYIDIHGNIKATQINHLTNTTNEVLIRSWFQPDDHDNPTFLVLPDERIMVFYSRHTDESCFYYRVSQKPGDITTLGREVRLETDHNTTYPSPFILSDDPDHIYLCWRGIGWHPTVARLTLPDKNDVVQFDRGPYQIVQSQKGKRGVRPYAKYMSNGKDKIYLAYTTTHPDNQPVNYIYFNYIDIQTLDLKDIKGQTLATIGDGTLHEVDATPAYKNSYPDAVVEDAPFRNWLWEISVQDEDHPVIAMVRISEDKKSHDYYHVRWNGQEWQKTYLSNAGGHFHQTPDIEKCYSGGMAIDKANPAIIYGSVPVNGKHGNIYELKKFTVDVDGKLVSTKQLTFDSPKNNVRPFAIAHTKNDLRLAWMYGDYYDWIVSSSRPKGYPTGIHTNMSIPTSNIHIAKGKILQQSPGKISVEHRENIRVRKSKQFSMVMTLSIDHDAYFGKLLETDAFIYRLEKSEHPKPYLEIKNDTYKSINALGTADVWKTKNRGTGGQWHPPTKLDTFQLAITYEKGLLKTYINGLIDQNIEITGLSLSEIILGGYQGAIKDMQVYKRALSQDEIKTLQP
ncbi:BNR-4 repeat-containing protein [Sphingobacterium chuzhouense]|uniref:BNR-4 repeat-containing protein n=1 Tax=Sphingobacterium chuzhouense TaxID=1742264 RepID=A0ABR7XU66_9SPHI|nr:BNR-4 repeat-containing protein [Sphingobacterium chuzhouense]MBD1422537.1 BNR-4 repeat-containing protein [Sphingobacterium chuzhouense]